MNFIVTSCYCLYYNCMKLIASYPDCCLSVLFVLRTIVRLFACLSVCLMLKRCIFIKMNIFLFPSVFLMCFMKFACFCR